MLGMCSIDLAHDRFRQWLVAWWDQAITGIHIYQSDTKPKLVAKMLATISGDHLCMGYQN